MMTKADLENELRNAHQEIGKLRAQVEALIWHKQANDKFLTILGHTAQEGHLCISRTTRNEEPRK